MPTTIIQSQIRQTSLDQATYTDSVSKLRVSTPESLIDTDFEYGLQSVKWETIQLVNNIPTFFNRTGDVSFPLIDVQARSNSDYIYIYFNSTSPPLLSVGSPFLISGLNATFSSAEGAYVINKVISPTIYTYKSKQFQTYSGSIYNSYSTLMYPGQFYTATQYNLDQLASITTDGNNPSTITVNTLAPHGFSLNTVFSLVNSIGKKQIQFDSSLITNNTIYYSGHDFPDYTLLTYTNVSGATVTGLTNLTNYYTFNTTANTFQLSLTAYPGSAIAISSVIGQQTITSTDNSSDGASYAIGSIPTATSFTLPANTQILQNTYTFLPRNVLNMQSNCIYFPTTHKYASGAPLIYSALGNQPILNGVNGTALTTGGTYYAIRLDAYNLQLSTTPQYLPPYSPLILDYNYTSGVAGGNNQLTLNAIGGEKYGLGTFTPTIGSNVVYTNNINIQTISKTGDICRIENPGTTTVFTGVTINSATNLITGGAPALTSTTFATGTYLIITSLSGTNGLTSGYGYYVRWNASGGYNIYNRYSDAIANTSIQAFTGGTTTGTLTVNKPGYIFESPITFIGSSSKFITAATYNGSISGVPLNYMQHTGLYPRADGFTLHRPYDGGIELIPPKNADGQVIRQTRRYFRYQPGKGIQVSLSVNFSAPIEIDRLQTLTANTNIATATVKNPHRLSVGLSIIIDTLTTDASAGAPNTYPINPVSPWTGTFTIISCPDNNTFTYQMSSTIATPTFCPGMPIAYVNGWTGSKMRVGMFDDQNGMFFEYDGVNLYAVRRDAVTQITGSSSVQNGSAAVVGNTNNSFTSQLTQGMNIVIRGQTYRVANIASDSLFYIQPAYRGITSANVIISKITDTKTPQNQWNIDHCDGTGPTGYFLDIHKIQMIYYDFSWYGAGKIRYGFKEGSGIVRYVHEYIHNNNSLRAYFRSGNLPARYEVTNVGTPTWVPSLLHWGTSAIMDGRYDDDKAYLFTASANVIQFTAGDTIQAYVTSGSGALSTYTAGNIIDSNVLTAFYDAYQQKQITGYSIFTTAQSAGNVFSSNLSYKDVQNIRSGTPVSGTYIPANTTTIGTPQRGNITGILQSTGAPIYSGQVFINNIVSSPFNYAPITFGSSTDLIPNIIPLVSIRLTPSVDSSITGPLGTRELINRMLLKVRSVDLLSTNDTECRIYLNAYIDNQSWTAASVPSLAQLITHNKNDNIQGGTLIFSFRVSGGSTDTSGKRSSTVTNQDLSLLGSIQNSIIGGNNIYPDGPDIITICAICLDSAGVSATTPYIVSSRISWTEAQS
jgi:hypothetical protein